MEQHSVTPVTPVVTKKPMSRKIPILIGLCIAGLAIIILLQRGGLTKATDEKPANVAFTPTSSKSVTVTWSTGNPTIGQVLSSTNMDTLTGKSPTNAVPDYFPEEGDAKTDHSIVLDNLQAATTYYVEIQIGDSMYDDGGVPFTFTTPVSDSALNVTTSATKPQNSIANPFSASVTPIQHLVIPNSPAAVTPAASCNYTDCSDIKAHFGQGCSTSDYIQCLKK
jgi:hypothetical protein